MTLHTTAARLRTVDLVYVALFSVLIAVCAWISIPATIPFTLQTFGIFAALTFWAGGGGLTPPWSIFCWVLWDFRFSPGSRQESALAGRYRRLHPGLCRTGPGYWLLTAHLGTSVPAMAAAGVISLAVCYAFGTIWFLTVYARSTGPVSLGTALSWCVIPFILPDLGKLALAIALSLRLKKFLR